MGSRKAIEKLKELDLNCPEYLFLENYHDINKLEPGAEYSIRSIPKKDFPAFAKHSIMKILSKNFSYVEPHWPPHAYYILGNEAKGFCSILLALGIQPMVCKLIDPDDAVFAGAAIREENSIIIEIAIGPVMVRKVTRDGEVDFSFSYHINEVDTIEEKLKTLPNEVKEGLLNIAKEIAEKLPENHIIELSYYRIPIGWKRQKQIYWDIYDASNALEELKW